MAAKDVTCFEAAAVAAPAERWGDMEHNPEDDEEQCRALASDTRLRGSEAVRASKDEEKDEGKSTGAGEKPVAKEASAGGSAVRAMLSLPTPARSQAAPRLPGLVSGSPKGSPSSGRSESKRGGATPSAAPSKPPVGPEPWGAAQDSAQGAAPAKAGGYREYLQARGQQALQRSRLRGAQPPFAAAAGGVPPPPAGPPALAFDPSAYGTPTGGWSPAVTPVGGSPTAVAAWGIPGDMQVHAAQPWMQANAFGMPTVPPPAGARQPPYAPALPLQQALPVQPQLPMGAVCGPQPPVMMDMAAQQAPPACSPSYPQVPPAVTRSGSKSCVGSPIGEDLMATFMPEAFAMDRDQLAEQLRTAASCSYDD